MAGVWNTLRRLLQRLLRWWVVLMLAALGLAVLFLALTVAMAVLLVAMVGALLRGRRPTPQVWVQRYGQTAWRQGQGWARRGRSSGAGRTGNDVVDVQARDVEPNARPRLDDGSP